MSQSAEDILRPIIAQYACRAPEAVTRDALFERDLGMDSLDILEASMEIEDRFGIEIADADIRSLVTFGDLVTLVEGKARAQ